MDMKVLAQIAYNWKSSVNLAAISSL